MAPEPAQAVGVWIALDVTNLDASCAFYARTLGYSVQASHRTGGLYQERRLVAPGRALGLVLREAFGIRVVGSGPGHLTRVVLPVADLAGEVRRLGESVPWQVPPPAATAGPEAPPPAPSRFFDPDGYLIELAPAEPAWSIANTRT